MLAHFLIAALAGFLSRQLLAAGGRLSASQENLRRLATLHEQILDSTPSGLLTCEEDGHVTFINRAAVTILGLEDAVARNMGVHELLPGLPDQLPGLDVRELDDTNHYTVVMTDAGAARVGAALDEQLAARA